MAIRIQLRRDTAANWISSNPVLRQGEMGIETDTLKIKLGDGTSTWTQITAYMNLVPDGNSTIGDYVMVTDIGAAQGVVGLDNNKNAIVTGSSIILEGATDNAYETTLTVTDPTADRTITFKNADGTVAFIADIPSTTDALTEGSTNKYFSDERAQDAVANALAAGSHTNITVTYNDAANSLSIAAAPGYTDEQAQDAVAAALAAGTHTNISVSYNDAGNAISLTGAQTYNDENAQDAIGNNLGTGLSYNDTTGAISVNTSVIQARVANVDDTEIGYLDGVTSSIQTQLNSKAPLASPALTGVPTAPTALASTNTTQIATTEFVKTSVNNLINGAGAAYDTLKELSDLIIADESTASSLATLVGTKAPIASPTFTGTVSGITKTMVGLGNVDNTSDTAKPISSATQAALDLKAPLASPTFTGTVSGITKTMVGLSNVDNTSDASKPISTLTQAALDLKLASATAASTYATIESPTFTGTATLGGSGDFVLNGTTNIRITPASGSNAYVGTAVADNIITTAGNTQTLTNKSLTSPTLTGTPTAPTAAVATNTTQVATTAFVRGEVTALVNGASAALDTLGELAAALTADEATAATLATLVGTKAPIVSPTFTGTVSGITKTMVGLGNVDNTSDTSKPISTATQTALDFKAPLASPTFTGTVSGITKTMVGLGNVDNTTDALKPISTATQTALDAKLASATAATTYETITNVALKAPLASPALTGSPTAPTALAADNSTKIATTAYADRAASNATAALVASAPAALDTLNELAAALGNDASFSTTVTNSIATKAPIASPTFTGTVSGITKTMVGLGNVDNTADSAKPISTATQTALDNKVSTLGGSTIAASVASTIPLVVKGAASRSVALQDWQTSDGTSMLKLTDTSLALGIGAAANTSGFILLGGAYAGFGAAEWHLRRDGGSLRIQSPAGSQIYSIYDSISLIINAHGSQTNDLTQWKNSSGTVVSKIDKDGNITAPSITLSTTALSTTSGGTGLSSYTTGDLLYSSATNTLSKLAAGADGYILTLASGVPSWAAAPITLPSQTGNSGKYLTTNGTSASWGTLVVPITTGTATVNQNTAQDVDTTALSAFTSIEYMVSIKQGSKTRTSKVILQTDGTSVDMTEFAITETGGTLAGIVVSATTASSNAKLQVTVTDALSTNATVKFSKIAL
jgi:hypothetical protein